MSLATTTYWYALSIIGKLPNELIVKILYEFNGFKHPVVNMLLSRTRVDKWEQLQKLPFCRSIKNLYHQSGMNNDIINMMNTKQTKYFEGNCYSYVHWRDPGCFIPRSNGRLYYLLMYDNEKVDTKSKMYLWKLNRHLSL